MICQNCKKAPASVCITQIVESRKTDTYLCQSCANESAMKLQPPLGLFDVPGHLVFGPDLGRLVKQTGNERCDGCGITFAEIQKTGKLGCANCYSTFRAKLRPIITRIHRSAQHRGKNPAGASEAQKAYEKRMSRLAEANADANTDANAEASADASAGASAGANAEANAGANAGTNAGANADAYVSGISETKPEAPYFSENSQTPDIPARIEALKASLAEAIIGEEYEKAADLRDQIKALEK